MADLTRSRNLVSIVVYAASGSGWSQRVGAAAQPESDEGRSAFGFRPPFAAADPVAYGADLHLLVGPAPGGQGKGSILEVLSDRHEGRIGRWGEFAVDGRFQLTR